MLEQKNLKNRPVILAIESTCDETSIALIVGSELVFHKTLSSITDHIEWGGVVPELASRAHEVYLPKILNELLIKHNLQTIDIIAYASQPGLLGSLHVGKVFAALLAKIFGAKLIPINHVISHALSASLTHELEFPLLSLVVSGGHSQIYYFETPTSYRIVVDNIDDAAGEAYDKVGKILGFSYPAGPLIDKIYDPNKVDPSLFPRKSLQKDFSFSGIKSRMALLVAKQPLDQKLDVVKFASTFQF
jgi:N6-L-threonylcarbamoyladenine synthase